MSITADSLPALLTPAEAADLLGRSRSWVYDCVRRGSFLGVPVVKESGRCFVPGHAVSAYLTGQTSDLSAVRQELAGVREEVAALRRLLAGVFAIGAESAARQQADAARQQGGK